MTQVLEKEDRYAQFVEDFERLWPKVEASLNYAYPTYSKSDIFEMILDGKMHFWPIGNSVTISELVDFPQHRILNLFIGGGDAGELLGAGETFESWARHLKCDRIALLGRAGWSPRLRALGWTDHKMSYFSKPLKGETDE